MSGADAPAGSEGRTGARGALRAEVKERGRVALAPAADGAARSPPAPEQWGCAARVVPCAGVQQAEGLFGARDGACLPACLVGRPEKPVIGRGWRAEDACEGTPAGPVLRPPRPA